jgi:hypothetical protein
MRTKLLFSPPNREVGNPTRMKVKSIKEIEDFVTLNNGVSRAMFCTVYDLRLIINKIFLDFDGPLARDAVEKILLYLYEISQEPLTTFSGEKGYHLWQVLKPMKNATPKDLEHATLCLLKDCDLLTSVGGHLSGKPVDSTCIGDVRRFGRIPNTLRPPSNKYWCTWLPDTFLTWTPKRLLQWVKTPHYYDDYPEAKLTLRDLQTHSYDDIRKEFLEHLNRTTQTYVSADVISNGSNGGTKELLVKWFSPFMARRIAQNIVYVPEPEQTDRFIATKALMEAGFSHSTILNMFYKCGWIDFDVEITNKYILSIDQNKYVDRDKWKKQRKK